MAEPVDDALAVLRAMARAAPVTEAAQTAAAGISEARARVPLTVGIRGDSAGRAELLAHLTGGDLDWSSRPPGGAGLRIRRGAETRFRARGKDVDVAAVLAPTGRPARALATEAAAAATELEHEVVRAEARVPAVIRRAPPWWAIWLWMLRWILTPVRRREVAAWRGAIAALDGARREVRVLSDGAAAIEARTRDDRLRFVERLRELASGAGAGLAVREIELEIAGGPLSPDVEVLELTGWSRAGADVDGMIDVRADMPIAELVAALPAILRGARTLRLTRRALDAIGEAVHTLDDALAAAEAHFAARIARLESYRLGDPDGFVADQLARLRPQGHASVHALIDHASVHVAGELARRATAWTAMITAAKTGDELAAAAAAIESDVPAAGQRIAEEVRQLTISGLTGVVHDLTPSLLEPLTAHVVPGDLPAPPSGVVALPAVTMLPSLADAARPELAAGWLSTKLRGVDGLRRDLADKVAQRAKKLRTVAAAEVLDAEPSLRAAVDAALTAALTEAIDAQTARLDASLARLRETVEAERAAMAPLVEARTAGRAGAQRLVAAVKTLATEHPTAAAAAVATFG